MKGILLSTLVVATFAASGALAVDKNFTAIYANSGRAPSVTNNFNTYFNIPASRIMVYSNTLSGNYYFARFSFVDDANTCQFSSPTAAPGGSGGGVGSGSGTSGIMDREFTPQADCYPTTTNYSVTPAIILNHLFSVATVAQVTDLGMVELWNAGQSSPNTEPTSKSLAIASYNLVTPSSMGWGYAGGVQVQIESGNMWGSICPSGMSQGTGAVAVSICNAVDPSTTYTTGGLFMGASTNGGFIAVGGVVDSNGITASVYNNFTYKGDNCTHADDLGVICGTDVFTTETSGQETSTITYTVQTTAPSLVASYVEFVTMGLVPASLLSVTTTNTLASFHITGANTATGFTKLDLDGILQCISVFAWKKTGLVSSVSWDTNVVFKDKSSGGPSTGTPPPFSTSSTASEGGFNEWHDAVLFTAIVTVGGSASAEAQLKADINSTFMMSPSRVYVVSSTATGPYTKVVFYFVDVQDTCYTSNPFCYTQQSQFDWSRKPQFLLSNEMLTVSAKMNLQSLHIVQLWSNSTVTSPQTSPASASSSTVDIKGAVFKIGAAPYSPLVPSEPDTPPRIGHLKTQLMPDTMWGSLCGLDSSQNAAPLVCQKLFPDMNVSAAAFFVGDSSQGFLAAAGLSAAGGGTAAFSLTASTTSNLTTINTPTTCTHMYDIAVVCNPKAVAYADSNDYGKIPKYVAETALSAQEVGSAIETITLGTVPASIVSASSTGNNEITFSLTDGHGGLERLDLDGVLQMTGSWILNQNGIVSLQFDVTVMAGTPTEPTTSTAATSASGGQQDSTTTQTGHATTTSGGGAATTTTKAGQTTTQGGSTTTGSGGSATGATTTAKGATTTATTTSQGQGNTTGGSSGTTTTGSGTATTQGNATGGSSATMTTTGQATGPTSTTTTPTTTTSTTTTPTTTTSTTTTPTTTQPPKPKVSMVVASNMTASDLESSIKAALNNTNASVSIDCGDAGSSGRKTCVVEFQSNSEAAIVTDKANSNQMTNVYSAAAADGTTAAPTDDDDSSNTTLIIIVVVVVVVVVLAVGAGIFFMVKKRGVQGTGHSFMDMEQEMALNDPMDFGKNNGGGVSL